jgi:hypothetical protein
MDEDFNMNLTTSQIRAFLQGDDEMDGAIAGALDELQGAALTRESGKATLIITCTKDLTP